jgi:hypothetical protein
LPYSLADEKKRVERNRLPLDIVVVSYGSNLLDGFVDPEAVTRAVGDDFFTSEPDRDLSLSGGGAVRGVH